MKKSIRLKEPESHPKKTGDVFKNFSGCFKNLADISKIIIENFNKISEDIGILLENKNNSAELFADLEKSLSDLSEHFNDNKKDILDVLNIIEKTKRDVIELNGIVDLTTERTIKAIEIFENLSAYSKTITDIVNVVSNVAEQTTLLAFNAAIEAAKAGDYGIGFAVVADEVGTLAVTSDKNVREIESLINSTSSIISSVTNEINKLRLLAKLNKRKTEIINDCMDNIKNMLIHNNQIVDTIIKDILESNNRITALKEQFIGFSDNSEKIKTEVNSSVGEISNLLKKVSTDSNLFNKLIHINNNRNSNLIYNEHVEHSTSLIDQISSSIRTYRTNKLIKYSFSESRSAFQEIMNFTDEFIRNITFIRDEIKDNSLKCRELSNIQSSILNQVGMIKASDHIIYNEILENSIHNREIYEGQINPAKCAFGKWFVKFKPQDEYEEKIYNESNLLHLQIHSSLSEIVILMKQNNYEVPAKIYKEKIIPLTGEFINKISLLSEGIVSVGTGFNYSVLLFDKINKKIQELLKPFTKISKVVSEIDNISIQTNMLAINGSIEAARAGEYGKGFAFVGEDIKNLASETSENNEKMKEILERIFELMELADKEFDEVNLLIVHQGNSANTSVQSLMEIGRMIFHSNVIFESLNKDQEELIVKGDRYFKNFDDLNILIKNIDGVLEKLGLNIKSYILDINQLENTFEDLESEL